MNMLSVIAPKSDQINADDLNGKTITITVTEVIFTSGEQPVSIYFDGSDKAYRPCKSMCRVMVAAWGPDVSKYVGKSMTLYCDPKVMFGPLAVGGVRISHMSHIDDKLTIALTATKGVKKPFVVKPLRMDAAAPALPATDKVADGVAALIDRINACTEAADVMAITTDAAVMKQRAWLLANRADLAAQVSEAITTALDSAGEKHGDPEMGDGFDGTDKAGAL